MPKSKETISDSDSDSVSEQEVKQKSKPKKQEKKKQASSDSESEAEVKQKSKPKKAQKRKESSDEESESDDAKSRKRPKKGKEDKGSNKKAKTGSKCINESGEEYWELGNSKRATVRSFKGKLMVDIREFYDAGGEMKPGKRGVALQMDNWRALLEVIDEVDKCVKSK